MIRHAARLTSVLAGAGALGVLVAGPSSALIPQPSPVPLPLVPCPVIWDNVFIGGPGDDVIQGTNGNDLILGLGGDDRLYGDDGRDAIFGGDDDDEMVGGRGDDCLVGGAGDDWSVLFYFSMPNGNDQNQSLAFRYLY